MTNWIQNLIITWGPHVVMPCTAAALVSDIREENHWSHKKYEEKKIVQNPNIGKKKTEKSW